MTPQEQLTAKIREALPHLMELKENCILTKENDTFYKVVSICKNNMYVIRHKDNELCILNNPLFEDYEIIGAEPTLNDVLMYLYKSEKFKNTKLGQGIELQLKILDLYNLQLPYSQQSDEWFNFMLGL